MGRGRDSSTQELTPTAAQVFRPVEMPIVQQTLQTILRPAPQRMPTFTPIRSVAPQQQPTPFRAPAPLPSPIVAPVRFRSVAPPQAPQDQLSIIVPIEEQVEVAASSVAGGSAGVGAEESQWSGGAVQGASGASAPSVAPTKAPTKQQPPKRVKVEQHGSKGDM
jgi:hypothetical protein